MISVIVPVYNEGKYLRQCVDSIINQTYKNLEIILIDDGSTDDSGVICDEYAKLDSRVKAIHKQNAGQSIARNQGLDIATGDYIGFVDSDDTICPDMFARLREAIDGVDISICQHNVVYPDKSVPCSSDGGVDTLSQDELWEEIFGRLNNAVWNKLFRKELLKGIYFDPDFAHGEDLIFNIQHLSRAKSCRIVKLPLYNYYKRGDSITTGKFTRRNLLEISSKEEARRLIAEIYPAMISTADKYCYRARANVVRNIYKFNLASEYQPELSEYRSYILSHYPLVKHTLKVKEKIEFFLYKYLPFAYKILAKRYR